jgi:hypothetical protein
MELNSDVVLAIVPVVVGCAGVAAIVLGVWFRVRARMDRSRRAAWSATAGSIESSGVTVRESRTGDVDTTRYINRFSAVYSYATGGTSYRGSIFSDQKKNHPALLTKYHAGAAVQVFYDPAQPAHGEIRDPLVLAGGWAAGLNRSGLVLIPVGFILAFLGLMSHIVFH